MLARTDLAEGLRETFGLLTWFLENKLMVAMEHSIVPKFYEIFMNLNVPGDALQGFKHCNIRAHQGGPQGNEKPMVVVPSVPAGEGVSCY